MNNIPPAGYSPELRLHMRDLSASGSLDPAGPSVVDPDPDSPGSAFIRLSWIRIRIGNADPDPGAWNWTKIYT
jgi:hypothetical protein